MSTLTSGRRNRWAFLFITVFAVFPFFQAAQLVAQERPYFMTYTHDMEEPGNLEIAFKGVTGKPQLANRFTAAALELEYGVNGWWTSEFYLDGQSTQHDSTIFTGYKIENRFRPPMREHWINPVLYVEFENISADKTLREIMGHDGKDDFIDPNGESRIEKKREIELKLILSSNFKGWNVAENIIAEKNLTNEPWEFGYALAASRPLKFSASAHQCAFCAEKFSAGAEMYGGLGDRYSFGTHLTSQYLGPTVNWTSPGGTTISFSPSFGLNDYSIPRLYRFGVSYEIPQILSAFRKGGAR
ncbi:MAG TPA: hypothetical protein VM578_09570 [Candidatus Saccharimonadales bacterium]|nr:hypothetical protein [Candidatus Saccharimonadales bacterium]